MESAVKIAMWLAPAVCRANMASFFVGSIAATTIVIPVKLIDIARNGLAFWTIHVSFPMILKKQKSGSSFVPIKNGQRERGRVLFILQPTGTKL